MKKQEKTFYDIFNIGMEIEMETKRIALQEATNSPYIKVDSDGSLRPQHQGLLLEITNKNIIKSDEEEKLFINGMKEHFKEWESTEKVPIFAHQNPTCGTHIHFSFKKLKEPMLYVFDTLAFEKFFFIQYAKTFNSQKFLSRLHSEYCQLPWFKDEQNDEKSTNVNEIRDFLDKTTIIHFNEEKSKLSQERYRWLNTLSIKNNTGLEIRIFPHLQTYTGIQQVFDFCKKTILHFYLKPETQQRFLLLKAYETRFKDKKINYKELNELKKIAFSLLKLNRIGTNQFEPTGEVRILIANWFQQQPSLIRFNKTI